MFEWLPLVSGLMLGVGAARLRCALGTSAILVAIATIALAATVWSGEATRSWGYLAIDLVQTALGFAVGFLTVAWRRRRTTAK